MWNARDVKRVESWRWWETEKGSEKVEERKQDRDKDQKVEER